MKEVQPVRHDVRNDARNDVRHDVRRETTERMNNQFDPRSEAVSRPRRDDESTRRSYRINDEEERRIARREDDERRLGKRAEEERTTKTYDERYSKSRTREEDFKSSRFDLDVNRRERKIKDYSEHLEDDRQTYKSHATFTRDAEPYKRRDKPEMHRSEYTEPRPRIHYDGDDESIYRRKLPDDHAGSDFKDFENRKQFRPRDRSEHRR